MFRAMSNDYHQNLLRCQPNLGTTSFSCRIEGISQEAGAFYKNCVYNINASGTDQIFCVHRRWKSVPKQSCPDS